MISNNTRSKRSEVNGDVVDSDKNFPPLPTQNSIAKQLPQQDDFKVFKTKREIKKKKLEEKRVQKLLKCAEDANNVLKQSDVEVNARDDITAIKKKEVPANVIRRNNGVNKKNEIPKTSTNENGEGFVSTSVTSHSQESVMVQTFSESVTKNKVVLNSCTVAGASSDDHHQNFENCHHEVNIGQQIDERVVLSTALPRSLPKVLPSQQQEDSRTVISKAAGVQNSQAQQTTKKPNHGPSATVTSGAYLQTLQNLKQHSLHNIVDKNTGLGANSVSDNTQRYQAQRNWHINQQKGFEQNCLQADQVNTNERTPLRPHSTEDSRNHWQNHCETFQQYCHDDVQEETNGQHDDPVASVTFSPAMVPVHQVESRHTGHLNGIAQNNIQGKQKTTCHRTNVGPHAAIASSFSYSQNQCENPGQHSYYTSNLSSDQQMRNNQQYSDTSSEVYISQQNTPVAVSASGSTFEHNHSRTQHCDANNWTAHEPMHNGFQKNSYRMNNNPMMNDSHFHKRSNAHKVPSSQFNQHYNSASKFHHQQRYVSNGVSNGPGRGFTKGFSASHQKNEQHQNSFNQNYSHRYHRSYRGRYSGRGRNFYQSHHQDKETEENTKVAKELQRIMKDQFLINAIATAGVTPAVIPPQSVTIPTNLFQQTPAVMPPQSVTIPTNLFQQNPFPFQQNTSFPPLQQAPTLLGQPSGMSAFIDPVTALKMACFLQNFK